MSAVVVAAVTLVGAVGLLRTTAYPEFHLHSQTVALSAPGDPVRVQTSDPSALYPGTRVLRSAPGHLASAQRAWLSRSTLTSRTHRDMLREALLDLRTLTSRNGAVVAAWSPIWRYVWPRDAAFVAAAFARAGYHDDARRLLGYLQSVQPPGGSFEARYRPDGPQPPDDRGVQLDGAGWVLWATAELVRELPPDERRPELATLNRLLHRSTDAVRRATDDGRSLPPPSPDYWEVAEQDVTLGNAAPQLVGLEAAVRIAQAVPGVLPTHELAEAAARYRTVLESAFRPGGWSRYRDRAALDAAVTFLQPPFLDRPLVGVTQSWARAARALVRPAGGLAPGAGWRQDGVSWTPQTSLFALTAAGTGQRQEAERWLRWLDGHRTAQGSLPEKVLADGSPAGPAPVAWTAANVVIALDVLADAATG